MNNPLADEALAFGNRVNLLVAVLLALICLTGSRWAWSAQVQIGSEMTAVISVCSSKEDAMKVVDATQESKEKADTLFDAAPNCDNVPVRFKIGNVVHHVTMGDKLMKVVEITDPDGKPGTLYWLTSFHIVKYKTENET